MSCCRLLVFELEERLGKRGEWKKVLEKVTRNFWGSGLVEGFGFLQSCWVGQLLFCLGFFVGLLFGWLIGLRLGFGWWSSVFWVG